MEDLEPSVTESIDWDEFMIPPTPTRMGISTGDIEEESDITAILNNHEDSLAALTGEVVEAQKYQSNEFSRKKEKLVQLKNQLRLQKQQYEHLQLNVKSTNRQLYMVQDNVNERQKNCQHFQKDIMELLDKKRSLQTKFLDVKWRLKDMCKEQLTYEKKMKCFRYNVQSCHEKNETYLDNLRLKKTLQELYIQLNGFTRDDIDVIKQCQSIKGEIQLMSAQKEHNELEMNSLEEQISREKDGVVILKKEIDAIHKRSTAQISRMKCQLRDSKERISRWWNENHILEEKIVAMKQKL